VGDAVGVAAEWVGVGKFAGDWVARGAVGFGADEVVVGVGGAVGGIHTPWAMLTLPLNAHPLNKNSPMRQHRAANEANLLNLFTVAPKMLYAGLCLQI